MTTFSLTAAGASLLLLSTTLTAAPAALAADALEPEAAQAAATYIASQIGADGLAGDPGLTADGILALLSVPGFEDEAQTLTDWLETQAPGYAGDGGPAAGKLAIVAAATGRDAHAFGEVDLVSAIAGSINPDTGLCGSWGYAFGQAMCILGLDRAGATVPEQAVSHLLSYQDAATGAFGYADWSTGDLVADNDASGLSLTALAGVLEMSGAMEAAVDARTYLRGAQHPDGYWTNYSPVNTTGLVAPAMTLVGDDMSLAATWMVGQQLADGGLPAILDGTSSDLRATVQGVLALSGESYLGVGEGGTDSVGLLLGPETVRGLAGTNRYATAALVSADTSHPVGVVYLTTGAQYADALAASARAGSEGAPVLLTRRDALPSQTQAELRRLAPERIVVVGGGAAVSREVLDSLSAFAGSVERIGGATRYETAALLAPPASASVFIATGQDYADALAASAAAGAHDAPVLLVRSGSVPPATAAALQALDPQEIILVGGSAAVSDDVADVLDDVAPLKRIAGEDRYGTAAAVARALTPAATGATVTTGEDWPDALTGAARAAQLTEPVLLVRRDAVPDATSSALVQIAPSLITVLGGRAAVGTEVHEMLAALNYAG